MANKIAPTLDSVLGQDYQNLESVVIDGGSSDGSKAIFESYGSRLSYWVSEPDYGLYDGMNKGVRAATGSWVIFMNVGDRFASADVLSRIFAEPHDLADILYGHHLRHYAEHGIYRHVMAEAPSILPRRMHCSHQATLMRRQLILDRPFAIDLLAADYDAILAAYDGGKRFQAVDVTVAITEKGGRSDKFRQRMLGERIALLRGKGLMTPSLARYYAWLSVRAVLAQILKKVLPATLMSTILRHRPLAGME